MNKLPHPKGRKVSQLSKKIVKAAAREKSKLRHQMKVNLLGERLLWFKKNLEEVDIYTPQMTKKLIESYLGRFNAELEQIQLKHSISKRKGRQHANREDIIKMTITNEETEYNTCGIEMVDVLNPAQLDLLKKWSGELRYLQNFKLVRYTKKKLEDDINSVKS
ncbi:translation machinery-associated protein, putative [Pediculus humanus corporis]|uniref:Translation machinery-associated protein, putative n=1 Tax=Pediculus humanus subsp. corporis TaxID=121224 RepID=E0VKT6_PEDHC|nr:translation machinery-associated protein, putative [Pediculus humanus corporis]EEB13992.1 translation machinery-associated protein, putative [Pediculus humanus corporis]